MILILFLSFYTPLILILAIKIDFAGAGNINILKLLNWAFGGCCRFLIEVYHFHHYMNKVHEILKTPDPNFISLDLFEGAKNPCVLQVLIWGYAGC